MYADNHSAATLQKSNKNFFALFFICCSLPFIFAKLALAFSWFDPGVTNKGQLLEDGAKILPATRQHWQLVYVQAGQCDSKCELALYTMQQIYMGLGRQQDQVHALIVADKTPAQLPHYATVHWQKNNIQRPDLQDHILIVNQQGLPILRYPAIQDSEKMLIVARDIRADLRRLMAYDRGGNLHEN